MTVPRLLAWLGGLLLGYKRPPATATPTPPSPRAKGPSAVRAKQLFTFSLL